MIVAARTALSLLAVVVIAWTAVLLRDLSLGEDAANRSFFAPDVGAAQRSDDRAALDDARFLNPGGAYWSLAHAYNRLVSGDRAGAVAEAEALVRDEPESTAAWGLLQAATRSSDPARAAQAARRLRELNPFGSR